MDPGPPPWGWYGPPPQEDHPQGMAVLLFGIFGIVTCQALGPVAWVMGRRVLAEIDAQPGRYANRSTVQVGYVCGIVASCLLAASLLFVLAAVALLFLPLAFA